MPYIVIVGDPIDGFSYYGPFDSKDDADRYIDQGNAGDDTAWLIALITPYSDDSA